MSEEDPGYHVDEIEEWIGELEHTQWEDNPQAVPKAITQLAIALYRIGGMLAQRLDDIDATLQEEEEEED